MTQRTMLSRAAALLAFALPTALLAQTLDLQGLRELDDDRTDVRFENRTVDEIEDMNVIAGNGERVGEIEEVLANADDEIVAVVIEYDEGFLDLGEREVVMPIGELQFGQEGRQVTTALTPDELRSLPVWDE